MVSRQPNERYQTQFQWTPGWIIKKVSPKVSALCRIFPFMDLTIRRFLMNSFFSSQFSYCPIIWMCHSRTVNSKINKLHERCLWIIYNEKKSSFKELLETDKSVPMHIKNLQVLATEMFKVYRKIISIKEYWLQFTTVFTIWITKRKKCFLWNSKYFISWPKNLEYCS